MFWEFMKECLENLKHLQAISKVRESEESK